MSICAQLGYLKAGMVLCHRSPTLLGAAIRWMLTHEVQCFHNHDEPILEDPESGCGLSVLVIAPPAARLVPLHERLPLLNNGGVLWAAIEPAWVSECNAVAIASWRREFSLLGRSLAGVDYSQGNLAAFALRIVAKFPLLGWLRRTRWVKAKYRNFHCTQGTITLFGMCSGRPWVPRSLANVAANRLSPKSIEHSIRADEWRFVGGDRPLFDRIHNAER